MPKRICSFNLQHETSLPLRKTKREVKTIRTMAIKVKFILPFEGYFEEGFSYDGKGFKTRIFIRLSSCSPTNIQSCKKIFHHLVWFMEVLKEVFFSSLRNGNYSSQMIMPSLVSEGRKGRCVRGKPEKVWSVSPSLFLSFWHQHTQANMKRREKLFFSCAIKPSAMQNFYNSFNILWNCLFCYCNCRVLCWVLNVKRTSHHKYSEMAPYYHFISLTFKYLRYSPVGN